MLWGMVIGTVAFGTAVALVLASAQSLSRRRLRRAEARQVDRDFTSR